MNKVNKFLIGIISIGFRVASVVFVSMNIEKISAQGTKNSNVNSTEESTTQIIDTETSGLVQGITNGARGTEYEPCKCNETQDGTGVDMGKIVSDKRDDLNHIDTDTDYVLHTVTPLDTLSTLSLKYGVPIECIKELNCISDINMIYDGSVLKIPVKK